MLPNVKTCGFPWETSLLTEGIVSKKFDVSGAFLLGRSAIFSRNKNEKIHVYVQW